MPHVHIEHRTVYRYAAPVRLTGHRLMLRPRDSHDLRLNDATLGLTPPAAQLRWAHDVFDNSICFVDFAGARADTLRIVSTLDLEHYPSQTDLPLDPLAEFYPFSYAVEEMPDLARLLERQMSDPQRMLDAWARRFVAGSGPTRTLPLLAAMTEAIKADFIYQEREAEGTNPPLVTLATRRG